MQTPTIEIISCTTTDELAEKLVEKIAAGNVPHGSVFVWMGELHIITLKIPEEGLAARL